MRKAGITFLLLLYALRWAPAAETKIVVGSKNFPESYILAEILAKVIERAENVKVERRLGFGGTGLVYQALVNGEIDLYPEYTGTLSQAILKNPSLKTTEQIRQALLSKDLMIGDSLGFNNTYALGMAAPLAKARKITKISDLKDASDIRAAFSYEFMNRPDGYPALAKRYGLTIKNVNRMEHSLAYEAIKRDQVDLVDVYTTDAKLEKLDLVLLEDDRSFFPIYNGVVLARTDFEDKAPAAWRALQNLEGQLTDDLMIHLNALAELEEKSFADVADIFLGSQIWSSLQRKADAPQPAPPGPVEDYFKQTESYWHHLADLTKEHLLLVFVSLAAAILVGFPLGIMAHRRKNWGQAILVTSGLFQTIPSLALLCFLIPLFGIGLVPALVALFLYALLPIVRGTQAGLTALDPQLIDTARALGLSRSQRLMSIEIPMASISILSGIKTSAVISVGTATLAALIGAGGYGKLIVTGLALNDIQMILKGALPAALMAMVVHWVFEVVDWLLIPKGLKRLEE